MDILSNFSERLDELMFGCDDIKISALAGAIGVNTETVRLWKNGKRLIKLPQLVKLAEFFNCSLDFLSGRSLKEGTFKPFTGCKFIDNLNRIMKQGGITRYRLVKDTCIYDNYFTNWKKGAEPHLLTLIKLANYLGCTIDNLAGHE